MARPTRPTLPTRPTRPTRQTRRKAPRRKVSTGPRREDVR